MLKDPNERKCQLLIKKTERGIKHWNDYKAFIEYWNNIDNIYKNIEKYNPNKIYKVLMVFWWYDCWCA